MNKRLCHLLDNDSKLALNDQEKPRNAEFHQPLNQVKFEYVSHMPVNQMQQEMEVRIIFSGNSRYYLTKKFIENL